MNASFYVSQYSLQIFTEPCPVHIVENNTHLCPAGPCIMDSAVMATQNIAFRWKSVMYVPHNDHVEFQCTRGSPDGSSSMRRKCVEGDMTLPTCY